MDPTRDNNKKWKCYILHISGQEDVWIDMSSNNMGLKQPPLSYIAWPYKDLWVMYVSQGDIPMSVWDAAYQWIY